MKKIYVRLRRLLVHHILHIDDTPHRLALGAALGLFLAWTPTIGLQMLLVVILAPALRANVVVGSPVVWISNPVTMGPIYLWNYWVGRQFLSIFHDRPEASTAELKEMLSNLISEGNLFNLIQNPDFWHTMIDLLWRFGLDLWVGSLLIGVPIALAGYFVSYKFIIWYRTRTPRGRLFVLKMLHKRKKHNDATKQQEKTGDL
jgi:hypothetical protein